MTRNVASASDFNHAPFEFVQGLGIALVCCLLVSVGCDIPERPPIGPRPERAVLSIEEVETQLFDTASKSDSAAVAAAAKSGQFQSWETWQIYFQNQRPVGFNHIKAEAVDDFEDATSVSSLIDEERIPDVRYLIEDQVKVTAGDSEIVRYSKQTILKSLKFGLLEFDSAYRSGPLRMKHHGVTKNGRLSVSSIRGEQNEQTQIDWKETYRGFSGAHQSLRDDPIRSGERRTVRMLWPLRNKVATVRLYCVGHAVVPMFDGNSQTLLETYGKVTIDDKLVSEIVIWTADDGVIRRTFLPGSGIVSYLTTRQEVQKLVPPATSLESLASVSVEGEIERPVEVSRVAFQIGWLKTPDAETPDSEPPPVIDPAPCQHVSKRNSNPWRVMVECKGKARRSGFDVFEDRPGDAELEPSKLLDSGSAAVRDVVRRGVSDAVAEPQEIALQLARAVNLLLTYSDYSDEISRASLVRNKNQCDSVDYAILLAAALRVKEIPSRVAYGLRYVPATETEAARMKFHAWVVGWVDDRWMQFDATTGGKADPDRLTFGTTNLSENDLQQRLSELTKTMANLQIKILGTAY